jgi:hypothetical protein
MKVLFLDVDGVLNKIGTKERSEEGYIGIEPDLAARVVRILDETGAVVVLSSTWRRHSNMTMEVQRALGPSIKDRWEGKTPIMGIDRGYEIQKWIDTQSKYEQIESFCILDDNSDMAHLLPYLVQTSEFHGLTEEKADEAIKMLGKQPQPAAKNEKE